MGSQDEPEQPDLEELIDMAVPGDGEPIEMDAFIRRLETLAEEDHETGRTAVETATRAVAAVQDAFPTADVSLDSHAPEADVTLRVTSTEDDVDQEQVTAIVESATTGTDADIGVEIGRSEGDAVESDEAGGVIL